jgi:hypothetical protein
MTTPRWLPLGLVLAFLTVGLAACGSGSTSPETSAVESAAADDPCALVSDAELGKVFASGAPEGKSRLFGPGDGECEWEGDDAYLSVSVVPASNYTSDFVDQLNVSGPVDSATLGGDAVSFPGVVGIGRAAPGGTSVGFSQGDTGVIVAVKTGADGNPAADLALATKVAESIAAGL